MVFKCYFIDFHFFLPEPLQSDPKLPIHRTNRASFQIKKKPAEKCLGKVAEKAQDPEASVHMPRIACGLVGGKWEDIEPIIKRQLSEKDSAV